MDVDLLSPSILNQQKNQLLPLGRPGGGQGVQIHGEGVLWLQSHVHDECSGLCVCLSRLGYKLSDGEPASAKKRSACESGMSDCCSAGVRSGFLRSSFQRKSVRKVWEEKPCAVRRRDDSDPPVSATVPGLQIGHRHLGHNHAHLHRQRQLGLQRNLAGRVFDIC